MPSQERRYSNYLDMSNETVKDILTQLLATTSAKVDRWLSNGYEVPTNSFVFKDIDYLCIAQADPKKKLQVVLSLKRESVTTQTSLGFRSEILWIPYSMMISIPPKYNLKNNTLETPVVPICIISLIPEDGVYPIEWQNKIPESYLEDK